VRPAGEADRAALEAFLAARAEVAMFPLSNLLAQGMGGLHPRSMRFWIAGDPPEGVLGLTREGVALPVMPAALVPALAPEAARVLAGMPLLGVIGEAGAARALRAAAGLAEAPCDKAEEEGLFALDLDALRMPPVAGLRLVPAEAVPPELRRGWRAAYGIEALGWPEGEARARAGAEAAMAEARVLLHEDEPVAATGFNARGLGVVQVGGVWVPPERRRRGFGRAAVALHLAEAREGGARRAVLFTANPFAARAYRSLGFAERGAYALHLFARPQEARPA
jgi:GNAT superfamily N-acetyltransferase